MGVQCTVFGHVYDGTEFEEHRKERPSGEVLICREYQVCRRCGNRTEMYRNERLLKPRAPESEGTQEHESAGVSDLRTDAADESREDEGEGIDEGDETPLDDPTDPGEDDPADTSRIEAPQNAESPAVDVPIDEPPSEDVSIEEPTTDTANGAAGPPADTARDQLSADDSPANVFQTDDAVILTDGAADPESAVAGADRGGSRTDDLPNGSDSRSLFDHEIDDGTVGCHACGRTWDRGVTSLRDGDICPGCRRGYIETQ